MRQMKILWRPL